MEWLKKTLNTTWFFPLLVFYYGIFYIFLGEIYNRHDGLSMDGMVFSSLAKDFTASYFFDTYYAHRIFPSAIVGGVFKAFSITHTNQHVFIAFQILNILSLVLTCYYFKKLLLFFKISLKNQLLGFTLLLLNFAFIKYPFYLAVMTDSVALMLSTMLLYFYFKKNLLGLVTCTLISCFTWQLTFYQGLIFIIIPFSTLQFVEFKKTHEYGIKLLSGLIFGVFCFYLIYIAKMDTKLEFVARVNRTYVNISILAVATIYYYFSFIFLNKNLFNINVFFKSLKLSNIAIAICVLLGTTFVITYILNPLPNRFYSVSYGLLPSAFTIAMIWPFHSIVSHAAFFGIIIILLLFFWKDFSKLISRLGWGITIAFALNIYSFGIIPETRCLINLLPWIVILLIKSINKYSFSNLFYIAIGVLSIFASKIWVLLNYRGKYLYMQLDKNGSMGFPEQKLWLNIGPWMSESMYCLQGIIIIGICAILFPILYKVEKNDDNKIRLTKRYSS